MDLFLSFFHEHTPMASSTIIQTIIRGAAGCVQIPKKVTMHGYSEKRQIGKDESKKMNGLRNKSKFLYDL